MVLKPSIEKYMEHGNETREAKANRSKKRTMFAYLNDLMHKLPEMAGVQKKAGRKPNGFERLDLDDPDQLAKAIKLSMSQPK